MGPEDNFHQPVWHFIKSDHCSGLTLMNLPDASGRARQSIGVEDDLVWSTTVKPIQKQPTAK